LNVFDRPNKHIVKVTQADHHVNFNKAVNLYIAIHSINKANVTFLQCVYNMVIDAV